jgi:hypothetical protein
MYQSLVHCDQPTLGELSIYIISRFFFFGTYLNEVYGIGHNKDLLSAGWSPKWCHWLVQETGDYPIAEVHPVGSRPNCSSVQHDSLALLQTVGALRGDGQRLLECVAVAPRFDVYSACCSTQQR